MQHKRATNFTGAEGIALHKPGVCEAKHAKHKLLTTKACNRCGTGSSAILIKQESVSRANGFLRKLD